MDWVQFSIFVSAIVGLFFWNRSESRADIRHMEAQLNSNRELIHAIHLEMKDFHGRLCIIEQERNRR